MVNQEAHLYSSYKPQANKDSFNMQSSGKYGRSRDSQGLYNQG